MRASIFRSKQNKKAPKIGNAPGAAADDALLDPVDRLIVAALQRDGRQSNAEIARLLHVGESTARRRIDRLIRDGVIQVVAVAEPLRVGYTIYALIGLQVQTGRAPAVAKKLREFPEVTWLAIVAGQYDLMLAAVFEGPSELLRFVTVSLGQIQGITRTETFYILHMVKRAFDWRLPGPEASGRRRGPGRGRGS